MMTNRSRTQQDRDKDGFYFFCVLVDIFFQVNSPQQYFEVTYIGQKKDQGLSSILCIYYYAITYYALRTPNQYLCT